MKFRIPVWLKALLTPRRVPHVCKFSADHPGWDLHDYPRSAGGDGYPAHFLKYKCWSCGKEFYI